MKKIFNFTIFVVLSFLFVGMRLIGCAGIVINCPEFNIEILCWIPYQEDDVIELYSQSKDSTIMFSIESVEIRHTTDYKTGYDCGEGCNDHISINSHNEFIFQIDISIRKNKITGQSYRIEDTYFLDGNYSYSELKNYLFENEEYDLVRIFEKTDSRGTFKKLIIAKDIGIIGLVDIHGNTWSLKPNIKRRNLNEREGIVISNVSGC